VEASEVEDESEEEDGDNSDEEEIRRAASDRAPRRAVARGRKSYREADSNEDESDDDRRVDAARARRKVAAADQANVIDKVLDVRKRDDGVSEYLIHWSGESHLWDSWHTSAELDRVASAGLKKLSNYQRSVSEFDEWRLSAAAEEVEQAMVNIEMARGQRKEWMQVERIVASRTVSSLQVKEETRRRRKRAKRGRVDAREEQTAASVASSRITPAPLDTRHIAAAASSSAAAAVPPVPSSSATAASTSSSPLSSPVDLSPVAEPAPPSVGSVWAVNAGQHSNEADQCKTKDMNNMTPQLTTPTPPSASSSMTVSLIPIDNNHQSTPSPSPSPAVAPSPSTSPSSSPSPVPSISAPSASASDSDSSSSDDDDDDISLTTIQYYVKWHGLPYECCTWEWEEDIKQFQPQIDDFTNGGSQMAISEIHSNIPGLNKKSNKKSFVPMSQQPPYLTGGTLRDYQLAGLNWLAHNWTHNIQGILADEMGLGKSIQCLALLSWLAIQRSCTGPFLIVAPLSTIENWSRECSKWTPFLNAVVYIGSQRSREIIRQYEWYHDRTTGAGAGKGRAANRHHASSNQTKFNILITTYEMITKDRTHLGKIHWQYLMVDEAHRLKDSNSLLYQVLSDFHTEKRLLITGTPLQNTLRELWCLLHFLDPAKFASLDEFESRFSGVSHGEGIRDLHTLLLPHLLRRTKKDVLRSLPPKHERILAVDMAPMQRKYYRWILKGNFRELNKGVKGAKSQLTNICMELRKCTNSPLLFPRAKIDEAMAAEQTAAAIMQLNENKRQEEKKQQNSMETDQGDASQKQADGTPADGSAPTSSSSSSPSPSPSSSAPAVTASTMVFPGVTPGSSLDSLIRCSGKMILLDRLLLKLKERGHRCLIFSQMVRMLDLLSEYMQLRGFLHQRLDGSMNSAARQRAMDHFNAPDSPDFAFLLSTRAGGLGVNLTTADTVIIFDSDWNPQNDLQAEARAHRIGQTKSVNIYRLVTRNSVEAKILERAKKKMVLDHLVIQRMDTSGSSLSTSKGGNHTGSSGSGSAMFNRAELAKIVQFGAEDLFSKEDDESKSKALVDMDIDDILSRADATTEQQHQPGESHGEGEGDAATEAFLGAFKVANFSSNQQTVEEEDEEEEEEEEVDPTLWSRLVPSELIPADQLTSDRDGLSAPLYLPPRARNKPQSYAEKQLIAQNEARAREEAEEAGVAIDDEEADEAEAEEEEEDGEGRSRRSRRAPHEFDSLDARRIYRALMSVGSAELAVAELKRGAWKKRQVDEEAALTFTKGLINAAREADAEEKRKAEQGVDDKEDEAHDEEEGEADHEGTSRKRKRSHQFDYHGAQLSSNELLSRLSEFAALRRIVPKSSDASHFRLRLRRPPPAVKWALPPGRIWKPQHDAMLMLGVHWYGLSQWDKLCMDDRLGIKHILAIAHETDNEEEGKDESKANDSNTTEPSSSAQTDAVAASSASTPDMAMAMAAKESPAISDSAAVANTPITDATPSANATPTANPPPPSDTSTSSTPTLLTASTSQAAAVASTIPDTTTSPASAASQPQSHAATAHASDNDHIATPTVAPSSSSATVSPSSSSSPGARVSLVYTRLVKNSQLSARAATLLRAIHAEERMQAEEAGREAAKAAKAKERAKLAKERRKEKEKKERDSKASSKGRRADDRDEDGDERMDSDDEDEKGGKSASGRKGRSHKSSSSLTNNHRVDDMFRKQTTSRAASSPSRSQSPQSHSPPPSSPSHSHSTSTASPSGSTKSKSKPKHKQRKRSRSRSHSHSQSRSMSRSRSPSRERKKQKKMKMEKEKEKERKHKKKNDDNDDNSHKKKKQKTGDKSASIVSSSSSLSAASASSPSSSSSLPSRIEIDVEVLAQCKLLLPDLRDSLRRLHHLALVGFAQRKEESTSVLLHIGRRLAEVARESVPQGGIQREYLHQHMWAYVAEFTEKKFSPNKLRTIYKHFSAQTKANGEGSKPHHTPTKAKT